MKNLAKAIEKLTKEKRKRKSFNKLRKRYKKIAEEFEDLKKLMTVPESLTKAIKKINKPYTDALKKEKDRKTQQRLNNRRRGGYRRRYKAKR